MEPNYLAIGVAALAAWVLGALWYSPLLFGKAWQSELGFTEEDMKGANMPLIFGLSLVCMMVMCYGVNIVLMLHKPEELTFVHGMFHGAMFGLMFSLMTMGINYLYQRRSVKLFLIDGTYQVALLALAGGIMAVWQ